MSSIDLRLLALLQIAESPLYSAYRWLGRQMGGTIPMGEFFKLLAPLLDEDVVRLWCVDVATGERSRWAEIPADLERRFADTPDLDESFDPFGLSLTLGPAADVDATPQWEIDFDLEKRRFVVAAQSDAVDSAQGHLRRLFPDLVFVADSRDAFGDRVRVTGSVAERSVRADNHV